MQISVTCTIALLGPGVWVAEWTAVCFSLLSIWSCGLLCSAISGHLGLLVTVLFYVAILYRMKAAAATTQERTILKTRGYVERAPHDPFRNREWVCLSGPAYRTDLEACGWGGVQEGTKAFPSDAKTQEVSRVGLILTPFLFTSKETSACTFSYLTCNSSWKTELISCL